MFDNVFFAFTELVFRHPALHLLLHELDQHIVTLLIDDRLWELEGVVSNKKVLDLAANALDILLFFLLTDLLVDALAELFLRFYFERF